MTFKRFEKPGRRTLVASPPMTMAPEIQPKGYYVLADDEIGLYAVGTDRHELATELTGQIFFTWDKLCGSNVDVKRLSIGEMWSRDLLLERLSEE